MYFGAKGAVIKERIIAAGRPHTMQSRESSYKPSVKIIYGNCNVPEDVC